MFPISQTLAMSLSFKSKVPNKVTGADALAILAKHQKIQKLEKIPEIINDLSARNALTVYIPKKYNTPQIDNGVINTDSMIVGVQKVPGITLKVEFIEGAQQQDYKAPVSLRNRLTGPLNPGSPLASDLTTGISIKGFFGASFTLQISQRTLNSIKNGAYGPTASALATEIFNRGLDKFGGDQPAQIFFSLASLLNQGMTVSPSAPAYRKIPAKTNTVLSGLGVHIKPVNLPSTLPTGGNPPLPAFWEEEEPEFSLDELVQLPIHTLEETSNPLPSQTVAPPAIHQPPIGTRTIPIKTVASTQTIPTTTDQVQVNNNKVPSENFTSEQIDYTNPTTGEQVHYTYKSTQEKTGKKVVRKLIKTPSGTILQETPTQVQVKTPFDDDSSGMTIPVQTETAVQQEPTALF